VVARNPGPDSSLPYLLRLPIEGGVLLKARDRRPSTTRVYCHPLDAWPPTSRDPRAGRRPPCQRRGPAIDLILDRPRENRSQVVFTTPTPGGSAGAR
jgi:hypothetical protein